MASKTTLFYSLNGIHKAKLFRANVGVGMKFSGSGIIGVVGVQIRKRNYIPFFHVVVNLGFNIKPYYQTR